METALDRLNFLIGLKYKKKIVGKINTTYMLTAGNRAIILDRRTIEIVKDYSSAKKYAQKGVLVGLLRDNILINVMCNKNNAQSKVDRFLQVNTSAARSLYGLL